MATDDSRQNSRKGIHPNWLAGIGDWLTKPAPPPMPAPPRADPKAWTESLNMYHPAGGNETVAEIGGIINAETQGMKDRPGENESLSTARQKIAHVRMNGIRKYGSDLQKLAGMAPPKMSGPDYQASVDAARLAAIDDTLGIDPTHGATHYNMRTNTETARGGPFEQVFQPRTMSGPYASPTPYRWIWTYGKDPKREER